MKLKQYTALAVAVPRPTLDRRAEVVGRAASLTALVGWVQTLEPAATVKLYDGALVLYDGLPVRGLARAPERTIFLCGPADDAATSALP